METECRKPEDEHAFLPHMATSSTSTFPKKISLSTLSLLLLFLFCLFILNRRVFEPKLSLYTDRISQTPSPFLVSPPKSTEFREKLGDLREPVSSLSNVDENADDNVTVSSELSENEVQEKSKEEHVSSKSDFGEKTVQENKEPLISGDSGFQNNFGERNGEPMSSNEEITEPKSSKSDLDEKTIQENKEPLISSDSEIQNNFDGKNGEPMSSNEEKTVPISSKSNLGEKTTQENKEPLISPDSEFQNDFGEKNGDTMSSNEEITEPVSSKSDLDEKTTQENQEPFTSLETESEEDSGEGNGESVLSNEEIIEPISSNSNLGGKTRRKNGNIGVEEKSFEESPSSDAEIGGVIDNVIVEKLRNCDIYKGKWVKDEGYPLYRPGSCPYVDEAFDCQSNGRPDSEYTQWRWKPDECDLPRFNVTDFLVRLRGKRLMLVGDSMNRNQFESLLCILREGLQDKSRMYETRGYKITKGRGYYMFKFKDYNCTVEFVRSHFLVREGVRINGQGNSNPTLSIDRIDKTAARWQRADILVFNTGHWWAHGKTSKGKNYYKEGDYLYPHVDAVEAYRRAIKTWATWIKKNIKQRNLVFYRGYSSAHFRGGDWDSGGSCNGETEPVVRGAIIDSYPQKMTIVEEVIKETQVPVVLLNVTRLTNYRKDGHPSVYGKNVTRLKKVSTRRQDCSHWCLPGVPDAWNELIYATLVARQR